MQSEDSDSSDSTDRSGTVTRTRDRSGTVTDRDSHSIPTRDCDTHDSVTLLTDMRTVTPPTCSDLPINVGAHCGVVLDMRDAD